MVPAPQLSRRVCYVRDLLHSNAKTIPEPPFLIWGDRNFSDGAMARMVVSGRDPTQARP